MKRPILVLTVVLLILSGTLNCFCLPEKDNDLLSDLTTLGRLETPELWDSIKDYERVLEYQYKESSKIRRMVDEYSKSAHTAPLTVKDHDIVYTLGFRAKDVGDQSLLFRDELYKEYFKMRTSKVLEAYKATGRIDIEAFRKASRKEFDTYLGIVRRRAGKTDRLVLLLQDKLLEDRGPGAKGFEDSYIESVLSLRSPANSAKRNNSLYELMESRVRLMLLEDLVAINQEAVRTHLSSIKVKLNPSSNGVLSFRYASDIRAGAVSDYSVYMLADSTDFNLALSLDRLVHIYGEATFSERNGVVRKITRKSIWDSIKAGADGELSIDLKDSYLGENEVPGYDILASLLNLDMTEDLEKLLENKTMFESKHKEFQKPAQEIGKALNSMGSYLALREKGIENSYTTGFEKGKAAWRDNIKVKLDNMNRPGAAAGGKGERLSGFMNYTRSFIQYGRQCEAAGLQEDRATAAFREKVLQFKSIDEGALWIIDMLYKMKYSRYINTL